MNLQQLSENLGLEKEDLLELLELMVSSGGSDLEILKAALEAGDPDSAAKAAHSIKGATANLGLIELSEVAKEVELCAKGGQLQGLDKKIQVMREKFDELAALVE